MLLYVNDDIVEIRPGEFFEASHPVESRHLELIKEKKQTIVLQKKGRSKKKSFTESLEAKKINGTTSSSTQG